MDRMTWQDRADLLRKKKVQHTQQKKEKNGFMDADDYGTVPMPDSFTFQAIPNHSNGGFYGPTGWSVNFEAYMKEYPVYVDPLEILCGRWRGMLIQHAKGWPQDLYPYEELKREQELYGITTGIGADSHFAGDFSIGLALGWGGLLSKVRDYRDLHGEEKKEFYDAEERIILTIQHWIGRHIEEIKRLLEEEKTPEIRETLEKMLRCNEWVIEGAPRTFLEACQWVAWFATVSRIYDRDGAGFNLDVLLLPYYERDTAAGILDDGEARFIIANLLLIDTHYYQVSGADIDGNDLTNHLSYLVLEGAHMLNISNNLTVRYHDNMDREFFHKAVEYLFIDKNGWPRFSGDTGLMNYQKNKGVTKGDARNRIAVGCNWMAVPGKEYPLNDCIKINVAKVLDIAYHQMMQGEDYSLEKLMKIFEEHLKRAVEVTAKGIDIHFKHMHKVMPELVLDLIMHGTLEKGLNISQCAQLCTVGIDGVGLGTIADSLAAIEQRIVLEKKLSWQELYKAIQSNFEGVSGERTRLMLRASERYCQGDSLGDKWAVRVSELFARLVKEQPVPEGRELIPGWFSWSSTIMFGKQVGATADGRRAFTPVTHGANPNPGFRKDGAPTSMATGIAKVQPGYGNAAPLQLEMDPHLSAQEGGVEKVMQLLKTHMDMGGTLININVLDKEKLMEAHRDPSLHPDLVVRVTGFTAYFATLSPEFRQLVVDRFVEGL
ncbi:pyruvate formate lyase family protein [Anaerocolumna xylanovorans]|uniref:Formate C-acetyltransferase n=1 Tax=Anaerocolumna xylanovorans DSM 12503 TaxID=1121345 RepID=A0A1M7Y9T0_9FIRM|nr:pyruvate formate lyase family protein [Anaerocolumna xylanovorans]SHO49341.1 formate C-acetyltransferase [Anaerocolumna xylanovorans DSM 12503]